PSRRQPRGVRFQAERRGNGRDRQPQATGRSRGQSAARTQMGQLTSMRMTVAKATLPACLALLLIATASRAESAKPEKPSARASAAVQSCIKSARGGALQQERCIGIIADPCAKRPGAESTAGQVACADRELAVWDDILNETFRRLRDK